MSRETVMRQIATLISAGTREEIIGWLAANDRNGVYTDEDSQLEGFNPLDYDEAIAMLFDKLIDMI